MAFCFSTSAESSLTLFSAKYADPDNNAPIIGIAANARPGKPPTTPGNAFAAAPRAGLLACLYIPLTESIEALMQVFTTL